MKLIQLLLLVGTLLSANNVFALSCAQEKQILTNMMNEITDMRDVLLDTDWEHAYGDQLNGQNGYDLSAAYLLVQARAQIQGALPNCEKPHIKEERF